MALKKLFFTLKRLKSSSSLSSGQDTGQEPPPLLALVLSAVVCLQCTAALPQSLIVELAPTNCCLSFVWLQPTHSSWTHRTESIFGGLAEPRDAEGLVRLSKIDKELWLTPYNPCPTCWVENNNEDIWRHGGAFPLPCKFLSLYRLNSEMSDNLEHMRGAIFSLVSHLVWS